MAPISKHQTITTDLIVAGSNTTVAKFVDNSIPEQLYGNGTFRSQEFRRYSSGATVECTFAVSENSRYLLRVRGENDSFSSMASIAFDSGNSEPEEPKPIPAVIDGEWWGNIYLNPKFVKAFSVIDSMAKSSGAVNVRLTGSSGYGKTSLAGAFAQHTGRDFVHMNCALIRDPEEWFGFREAEDGSTVFRSTEFSRKIQDGNVVVLLDEANRLEPYLSNSLFPLLDDTRATTVHDERIEVGDNVVFILTINEGYQYVGTHEMDMALKNRINIHMEVGPLPRDIEIELLQKRCGVSVGQARQIVSALAILRNDETIEALNVDVTTRSSINMSMAVAAGMTLREAAEYVIIKAAHWADAKGLIDVVNSIFGVLED